MILASSSAGVSALTTGASALAKLAEVPVVRKYSPMPDLALLSPSRAAVNKPQTSEQIQRVFHEARILAGCTSSGFSVALEMTGSTKGSRSTARAQIAQALRWKIVTSVRRNSLMAQFRRFLSWLQVWPLPSKWRALWPSIIRALGISIES